MNEFSALYERHARDVFRFALSLARDRDEAEDIMSETFVRAMASSEPIRMATVKGYLFTIARNLYLQRLRGKQRHVQIDEAVRDPKPDPHAQAEQASEIGAAFAGMQRLSETDRTALLLRAVHEMPYDEIARTLGISVTAAKVRVHRARKALLGLREDRGGGGPDADERGRTKP